MPRAFGYEFEVGDDLQSLDNIQTLREAADERLAAAFGNPELESFMPAAGDFALRIDNPFEPLPPPSPPPPGGYLVGGWGELQRDVLNMAARFVRALDADGSEFGDVGDYTFWNGSAVTYVPEVDFTPPFDPWPPPRGVRRKYPREISTLQDEGEPGWVARLVANVDENDGPVTPAEQRIHSGKLFRYLAATEEAPAGWTEVTDGVTWDPDLIEEFTETRPEVGDYCGPWVPNDTRDAARRLRWTAETPVWTVPREEEFYWHASAGNHGNLIYACDLPQWLGLWATLLGAVSGHWGSEGFGEVLLGTVGGCSIGDPVPAQDAFASWAAARVSVATDPLFPVREPRASSGWSDFTGGVLPFPSVIGWAIDSAHAYPFLHRVALADRKKLIEWVVAGSFPDGPGTALFDSFGLDIQDEVTSVWASEVREGHDALGPKVGDASLMPTIPGGAAGAVTRRGYAAYMLAVIKWNVAGGFKHV